MALLSFYTSQAFFYRIFEESLSFFMPFSFFFFLTPKNQKAQTSRVSFQ